MPFTSLPALVPSSATHDDAAMLMLQPTTLKLTTVSSRLHIMAVWHSGSVVRRMNEVALRWAQLVLGWVTWVTVFGRVFHLGM